MSAMSSRDTGPVAQQMAAQSHATKPDAQAIRTYFETVYPPRQSPSNGTQFRRGEAERIAVVREWLSHCDSSEVLDVGCGDGVFLDSVLPSRTRRVRVEDIVPARVSEAVKHLERPGRIVEAAVADINVPSVSDETFDVVLVIGVLDYNPDWREIIPRLLLRSRKTLIVDFPSASCDYAEQRKSWLGEHGLDCRFVALAELQALLEPYAESVAIESLPYNWMVRISKTTPR